MWSSEQMSGGTNSASFERPIDLVHLAHQTLGDRSLEQEILALYLRQSQTLLERIETVSSDRERADLAHTLKGSSRAVGAWHVANAAEAVEIAPPGQDREKMRVIEALKTSVRAACETIAELQRSH